MKFCSLLIFCGAIVFFTGCATGNSGKQPERTAFQPVKVAEQELAGTGEKYFRQIILAIETGDYAKFSEHSIEEAKRQLTKEAFERLAINFRQRHGKLKHLQYLGSIDKYSGKILVWKAIFERTPFVNEQMKKAGYDPAKIPDTEILVQLMLGKTDQGWKVIRMGLQ
ncbi:MAG: hypothetical protein IJW05_11970 [Lentisphaeria bacterium]|nr:hypothetical protein [Lentisphaeria bacterium]